MSEKENPLLLKAQLESNSFHSAIRFSIRLAQFFSFFPIDVRGESLNSLEYKWRSWRTVYSTITFAVFIMEFFLIIYQLLQSPLNLITIKTLVFHLGGLTQYILFFKLTRNWSRFVKEWYKVETRMRNYAIVGNLKLRLNYMTATIMIFAGIEHALVNAYKLKRHLEQEPSAQEGFRAFFVNTYTYVFEVFAYSIWLGIIIQSTNLQRTFNWSYADVFVMLIGTAFTYRLKQMAKKIETLSRIRTNDVVQWSRVRKDYVLLTEMCRIINKRISSIIITCYLLNLYFVLVQLFSSLRTITNVVEKVYFYISFGLLIVRIVCVCIFGGSVYEEWKNIGFSLNSVSSSAYNIEVDRLAYHVSTWDLNLSGKNFFHISRGLILKIAGAIVTYELVLIQFYQKTTRNYE